MRKHLLVTYLILVVLTSQMYGQTFMEKGLVYKILGDSVSVKLTGYQSINQFEREQPFHIPATVLHEGKSYPIKCIGNEALAGLSVVESIIVEDGIESIGDFAFESCINLKSVYIPASVRAFYICKQLTDVVMQAGHTKIDKYAFVGCDALK